MPTPSPMPNLAPSERPAEWNAVGAAEFEFAIDLADVDEPAELLELFAVARARSSLCHLSCTLNAFTKS